MRIHEIKLLANRLESLKEFYHGLFGLPIKDNSDSCVSFQAGSSTLTFEHSAQAIAPFYHFAFNITESKIDQALEWLKAKGVAISVVDPYSESWNSHSVYFYDPVGNIVEFIARHNYMAHSDGDFSSDDILNISEIGLTADDVPELSAILLEQYAVPFFRPGSATFQPMGDEEGLFILAALDRLWFGSDKQAAVFPLHITMEAVTEGTSQLLSYPYIITTKWG